MKEEEEKLKQESDKEKLARDVEIGNLKKQKMELENEKNEILTSVRAIQKLLSRIIDKLTINPDEEKEVKNPDQSKQELEGLKNMTSDKLDNLEAMLDRVLTEKLEKKISSRIF